MNSICLGQSFTLTSSNNNLWVSMSISEILKTKSIVKYLKVLETHHCYHCPLFRLANILNLAGSLCYLETEISISPYSVYFRQKALKVILLYYLQMLFMVYYLCCVYFFCCNKKTAQHIPSIIIYFFSPLDFNFSENNMLQKLKHLVLHKPVLKPCIFFKDGKF